jgi:hypothetical protein
MRDFSTSAYVSNTQYLQFSIISAGNISFNGDSFKGEIIINIFQSTSVL